MDIFLYKQKKYLLLDYIYIILLILYDSKYLLELPFVRLLVQKNNKVITQPSIRPFHSATTNANGIKLCDMLD